MATTMIIEQALRIRALVQAELSEANLAPLASEVETCPSDSSVRLLSRTAAHHTAAGQRAYELLPVAELAAAIGAGFEVDSEPIGAELGAYVIETTRQQVSRARAAIDAFVWPAAGGDHVDVARAAQALARHAGLVRFVELFGADR